MVRAILTERQTSDFDVRCRITFSFQWKFNVYGPQLGWKTSMILTVKVEKRKICIFPNLSVNILLFYFYYTRIFHVLALISLWICVDVMPKSNGRKFEFIWTFRCNNKSVRVLTADNNSLSISNHKSGG